VIDKTAEYRERSHYSMMTLDLSVRPEPVEGLSFLFPTLGQKKRTRLRQAQPERQWFKLMSSGSKISLKIACLRVGRRVPLYGGGQGLAGLEFLAVFSRS
jgi:hypothetical protein